MPTRDGSYFFWKKYAKSRRRVAPENSQDCPVWEREGAKGFLGVIISSGKIGLSCTQLSAPSDPFPNRAGNFPALLMSPLRAAAWVGICFGLWAEQFYMKTQRILFDEETLVFLCYWDFL